MPIMRLTLAICVLLAGTAATAWSAEVAEAGHHPGGIRENLPVWGLVAFFGFAYALKRLGWDSLTSGMQTREQAENQLIADAEQLQQRTNELLRHNKGLMESIDEKVGEILAEAGRDADQTRSDIRAVADREARLSRQRAETEIHRVTSQSLKDIFETMADRVVAAAEQRIRSGLAAGQQERLMDETIGEFIAHR